MLTQGRAVVAAPGTTDADFEAQRLGLGQALAEHRIDEESARALIEDIGLRQAAQQTTMAVGPEA